MFTPVKNTKVYEQVIEQIKYMIVSGELKKGDRLPPERELVERLQVSRTSVREALRALQIIGLVECKQGGGNFIREQFEDNLIEPLSLMFTLQDSRNSEILELRRVLEVETASLAARSITDEELNALAEIIAGMKSHPDEQENVVLDKRFHYIIARASRNNLIVSILTAVSSLMDSFIKEAREAIINRDENKETLLEHHEKIYKALADHDEKKAAKVMEDHMNMIIKNMDLY
ncbi:FadR/GntR family transcriptional regulator [Youngiibacter fragilis]|uniref:GntR family transcriptional regulator n=1 Tax=Youngiibacter fragilis 232.1 TaxID=994573 RepID=V7I7B5_9CLOT|nr:FadR/GntR family transcriptional regulator [Youngiibacter fragilis]ETA80917.1 GntR family transcriptional regulator [Youngiibacter fragilis 232.1]